MARDSRQRMVAAAARLIGRRGYSATSFADVVAESGAPRGSIYHHFPGGKEQLAAEAIRAASTRATAHLGELAPTASAEVIGNFVGMWRALVVATQGAGGCTVAGVALDSGAQDGLIDVVRATFRDWIDLLADQLVTTGIDAGRARAVAATAVASMEGALILCRAEGDVGPLDAVASELDRLV